MPCKIPLQIKMCPIGIYKTWTSTSYAKYYLCIAHTYNHAICKEKIYSQGHVWPSSYGIVTAIFLRKNFVSEPFLGWCCFNLKNHAYIGVELEHMIYASHYSWTFTQFLKQSEGLFSQNALSHSFWERKRQISSQGLRYNFKLWRAINELLCLCNVLYD